VLVCVSLVVAVVVAGCGGGSAPRTTANAASSGSNASGGSKGSGGASQFANALKFARCMRSHGVPQFPDSHDPGGFSGAALAALNTSAPAYASATSTCQRLLPNDGQQTASEIQLAATNGVKVAKCMRAHGVNFPDPAVQGSHIVINLANVNTNSPAYTKAGQICATKPGG
jgi:hypothetical protein